MFVEALPEKSLGCGLLGRSLSPIVGVLRVAPALAGGGAPPLVESRHGPPILPFPFPNTTIIGARSHAAFVFGGA